MQLINNENFYTEVDLAGQEKRIRYFQDYFSKNKLLAQFRIFDNYILECHRDKLQKMINDPGSYNLEEIFGFNILYRFQMIEKILASKHNIKKLRVTVFEPLIKKIEDPRNQDY